MNQIRTCICAAVLLVGCQREQQIVYPKANPPQSGFVDTFLKELRSEKVSKSTPIVISGTNDFWAFRHGGNREELFSSVIEKSKKMEAEIQEAVLDFCVKNQRETRFNPEGGLTFRHVVRGFPEYQIPPFISESGTSEEEAKEALASLPISFETIHMSQPGFSSDGQTSVLYCSTSSGYDAGGGHFYVFEKVEDKWQRVELHLGWDWGRKE